MKTVAAFIKNHSFLVFVLLAYLLSWWLVPLNAGMLPVGPLLAALLVVGLSEGKAGMKVWWSQLVRRTRDWWWYVVAAMTPLVITFIAAGLNFLLGAQLVAPIDWSIPFKVLPLMLTGRIYWSDIVLVIAAQIVFTWLFNRTGGSVFAVMLFHLVNNIVSGVFIGGWFMGPDWVQLSWLLAGLWSLLALGLLFLDGAHLGRKQAVHSETRLPTFGTLKQGNRS